MSSIFRHLDKFYSPMFYVLENFCEAVFAEVEGDLNINAQIISISHYKEISGLEHEFLLANVSYAGKEHSLRMERSTPPRLRTSFLQKIRQTSSSILPALDTVRIASSVDMLTNGMNRGPSILVASLPVNSTAFTLRDLCLILCLFPAFSPNYKLREEQCYWFCDVVLSAISAAENSFPISRGEGFNRAGKFGKLSVNLSAPARQLFVDAYTIIRTVENRTGSDVPIKISLTSGHIKTLLLMLEVRSSEAKSRAINTLNSIALRSSEYRRLVVDEESAGYLARNFHSSSAELKAIIIKCLDTLDQLDSLFPRLTSVLLGNPSITTENTNPIEDLLLLLRDSREGIYSAGIDSLAKLAKYPNIRPSIEKAIPELVSLLASSNLNVRECSSYVLLKLTDYDGFRRPVCNAIPNMMQSKTPNIRLNALLALRNIVRTPETHAILQKIVPYTLSLLKDPDENIRSSCIDSVKVMTQYPELLQYFLEYLRKSSVNPSWKVRRDVIDIYVKFIPHAELHPIIHNTASHLLKLLNDENMYVSVSGILTIGRMAQHSELRLIVSRALPTLVGLLTHRSSAVSKEATSTLIDFTTYTPLRELLQNFIPKILLLLGDERYHTHVTWKQLLRRISEFSEFRTAMVSSFPQIIEFLGDDSHLVRTATANFVGALPACVEFYPVMEAAIPRIISFLGEDELLICGKEAIISMAEHPEICSVIYDCFPQIMSVLDGDSQEARENVVNLVADLVDHSELHPVVQRTISRIRIMLEDKEPSSRLSALTAIRKFDMHAELRPKISSMIPGLVSILKYSSPEIREEATEVMSCMVTHDEYHSDIRYVMVRIIALLHSRDYSVRKSGVQVLKSLLEHPYLYPTIKRALPQFPMLPSDQFHETREIVYALLHSYPDFDAKFLSSLLCFQNDAVPRTRRRRKNR